MSDLKTQRDRFLAFSFAASDLLIEVGEDDKVSYALGAAKGITGIDEKDLIGKRWLELFAPIDRPTLTSMKEKAPAGVRAGPYLATLNEDIGDDNKTVVTGIKIPENNIFYLTLAFGSILLAKLGQDTRKIEEAELLDKDTFGKAAEEAIEMAKSMGQDIDMTLFDLSADEKALERMGEQGYQNLKNAITQLICSKSIDGQTAAEIAEGKFSVIHDKDIDGETLRKQISIMAQENDPEGKGVAVQSKTVTAELASLTERDAARALFYTISEFERKGTDLTIENLNSGFKAYVSANAHKIKEFQNLIDRLDFSLHFQPIIDLHSLEASHYEMLCRFDAGDTQEWVMFGEDVGLAPEFDIAVCERAFNYIKFKGGTLATKFSINLSGQSISSKAFFDKLCDLLRKNEEIKERILFEITESTEITDLDKVANFIHELRQKGYKICLDDFGAGSASFQYIQALEVDYVKIDGKYTRKLLSSERDVALVKNLSNMCKDLGIQTIAEYVEKQDEADLLRDLGVDYAQGFLFGKAEAVPSYSSKKSSS